ncbi:phosphatase PAP2 family protein [Neobacillus ginsengisoli]|uniref:Phosphatidic acid phosphatase type 2/haloperoxidase domain-containing protein n=1 Tax=Neobacillus ginsengisoli TaxID=904295 RepID=A0ABT9XU76_9BACI|nr:phosphatase PAP2 family protein [Neobacillus ginsengisoli]MDQ0199105.1 hypothetical protein [Neobacillus ginsengisoli]
MKFNYPRWFHLPNGGQAFPPNNPEEPLAGTWPLVFLKRNDDGWFTDLYGNPLPDVRDPASIDWSSELKVVKGVLDKLTPKQERIAIYWGMGQVTKQWTPIIDRLIDRYTITATPLPPISLSTPRAARILAITQNAIQDALIVSWSIKYRFDVARPIQLDPDLEPILCTPRHPTYTSGHAMAAGAAATVLSYFFPAEADRLQELAEECSVSRIYGGVHFMADIEEGLKLGKAVGQAVINSIENEKNSSGEPVYTPFKNNLDAELPPPPYKQAIPFDFITICQSTVRCRLCNWVNRIKRFFGIW